MRSISSRQPAVLWKGLLFAMCWVAWGAAPEGRAADLSGRWEGRWISCTNGHDGKLRATLTKLDEDRYCAVFTGTFWHVLPFCYRVALTAEQHGDIVKLRGESDLGLLAGGTFSYEAEVSDTEFRATYTSCNDVGRFEMTRSCVWRCCE